MPGTPGRFWPTRRAAGSWPPPPRARSRCTTSTSTSPDGSPSRGRPVIFQAGDSDEGREFAAATADAIFSRHTTLEAGQAFHADVKSRLPRYGRRPDQLVVMPAATFVLGDTDAEAADRAYEVRRQQVSGATALVLLEQVWNRSGTAT
nr:LLM class flavin-dependent oxidoreductase [Actinokineospora iranica]